MNKKKLLSLLLAAVLLFSASACGLDAETTEQFAALAIDTGDGAVYFSFRGTDDTLAGWKEDFHMTYMPEIPAQKTAVEYITAAARQFPRKKLRLGGHSKGGNLAIWASVFCPTPIQKRILSVWSNDGPGFHADKLGDVGRAAILIARLGDTVRGSSCGPEAEAIVMLHHRDAAIHAGSLHRGHPLLGVGHGLGSISRLGLVAEAPLQACEGIHTIVEEGVKLRLVPQDLSLMGNRVTGCGHIVGVGQLLRHQLKLLGKSQRRQHEADK